MNSLFLQLIILLIILAVFVVWAEYNFINIYRRKELEKQDTEHNTLIFLLLHPDYQIRAFFLAFKRTNNKDVEKARIAFLVMITITFLYMFGIGIYIANY